MDPAHLRQYLLISVSLSNSGDNEESAFLLQICLYEEVAFDYQPLIVKRRMLIVKPSPHFVINITKRSKGPGRTGCGIKSGTH